MTATLSKRADQVRNGDTVLFKESAYRVIAHRVRSDRVEMVFADTNGGQDYWYDRDELLTVQVPE